METYNGFEIWIERDVEEDCIKNWHMYRPAGSNEAPRWAPLSPYEGMDTFRLWIGAGCPTKKGGNFLVLDGKLV